MKKIVSLLAAAAMAVSVAFAQDINEVTDMFNYGNEALSMGDKESAMEYPRMPSQLQKASVRQVAQLLKTARPSFHTS